MESLKLKKELQFDNDIYNTIRKNIKFYRKKGLTSAKLAEMIGLSHDFIRQIESEKSAYNFSVDTFYRISVALDVTLDMLSQKQQLDSKYKDHSLYNDKRFKDCRDVTLKRGSYQLSLLIFLSKIK